MFSLFLPGLSFYPSRCLFILLFRMNSELNQSKEESGSNNGGTLLQSSDDVFVASILHGPLVRNGTHNEQTSLLIDWDLVPPSPSITDPSEFEKNSHATDSPFSTIHLGNAC